MATYKLDNKYSDYQGHWTANTAYTLGQRVMAESGNSGDARKYMFECTTAGTSQNPGPPTWDTTPGNTTSDGTVTWTCREATSWDNAHGRLDWLMLLAGASDIIHVDDGHDYDYNVNAVITLQGSGTTSTRLMIVCVDKADDSASTGAKIQNTADNSSAGFLFKGSGYSFGVYYGTGGNIDVSDPTNGIYWSFEGTGDTLLFELQSTSTSLTRDITLGSVASPSKTQIIAIYGGNIKFNGGADKNYFYVYRNTFVLWQGGSFITTNSQSPIYTGATSGPLKFLFKDVDLSSASGNFIDASKTSRMNDMLFRCKLPAAFSPITGSFSEYRGTFKMYHCSDATNTYEFYEESYFGIVQDETTIVRSGGASDGTTSYSMKMVSSANVKEYYQPLISRRINVWNPTAGSSVTFTAYIYNSSADLNDDDVWMELFLPANDGGLGAVYFDKAGCGVGFNTKNPLATPAVQADDTSTWNGSSDYSQKLVITVTPGLAGQVTARIMLAKPSTTIYVDPVIYLS